MLEDKFGTTFCFYCHQRMMTTFFRTAHFAFWYIKFCFTVSSNVGISPNYSGTLIEIVRQSISLYMRKEMLNARKFNPIRPREVSVLDLTYTAIYVNHDATICRLLSSCLYLCFCVCVVFAWAAVGRSSARSPAPRNYPPLGTQRAFTLPNATRHYHSVSP